MKIPDESTLQKRFRFQKDLQVQDHLPKSYLLRNRQGQHCLHLAAAFGGIEYLPQEILTPDNLRDADHNGDTPLHIATKSGRLSELPLNDLPISFFVRRNDQGENIYTLAAARGYLKQLPEDIRLKDPDLIDLKFNNWITKGGGNLDPILLDPNLWTLQPVNRPRTTYLHLAAQNRLLHLLPNSLTGLSALVTADQSGQTPLGLTISLGSLDSILDRIPEDFDWSMMAHIPTKSSYYHLLAKYKQLQLLGTISIDTLSLRDGTGTSVIDTLYKAESLNILPEEFQWLQKDFRENRSKDLISRGQIRALPPNFDWRERMRDGSTPLHQAAKCGLLLQVPANLLHPSILLSTDSTGESVVTTAFKSGHIATIPEDLRYHAEGYPESLLEEWLKSGSWPDVSSMFKSPEFLLRSPGGARNGETFLHRAAASGLLGQLPQDCLTENCLTKIAGPTDESVITTAFKNGHIATIPEGLRHLAKGYAESLLKDGLNRGTLAEIPSVIKSPEFLLRSPENARNGETFLHQVAAAGLLGQLPEHCLTENCLSKSDQNGNTVLHTLVSFLRAATAPNCCFTRIRLLKTKNTNGQDVFQTASSLPGFGGFPICLFTPEILLSDDSSGMSIADIIESNGYTHLLPLSLQNYSKIKNIGILISRMRENFLALEEIRFKVSPDVVSEVLFQTIKRDFVRDWSTRFPDLKLDDEQADAVAEFGPHVQVTARAGSGKTRTLVARALFHITHCRVHPSSILILAFNKKAVGEIRERLSDYLNDEQMPHVLTFHALAYRIVKPAEDLIYDEGETKEGQVFSTTIQRIIDEGMRGGPLEAELRALMEERWQADLKRIIRLGFNLPQEEFLDLRASLSETTMNGRRVNSEAHKHIGNALLRLGIGYSYRRCIHRSAGTAYAPDFSHYHKETKQRFLIEVLGEDAAQANAARQAFWKSDRSANAHLLQLTEADCLDPDVTLERVARELAVRGIDVSPMSADELWLALRDDVIRDFTKAVKGFISRCQKELIEPEQLAGIIEARSSHSVEIQVQFWHLCEKIYARYRQVLIEQRQTDFDQLMLNAAGMIRDGNTGFKSARGSGDISQIRHLLIDEYQDFSHLFDELRKSIIARSPDVNFFCVGDDWQAINKFAGSDLRYFTGFTRTFEPSVRKLITRNYRSCRKIVEIGNRVMQGEGEPSIPNSNEQGNTWRVEAGAYGNLSEAEEVVIDELGDDALSILRIASDCTSRGESVAILSRTSSVATPEGMHKLEKWQERLRSFLPEKDRGLLEASTTHGYKGKEADVVILLDPEAYPFVHPDAIFSTIFGDTFQSIQDDEKRLFYVGVTRPKNTLYLLSYPSRYSDERPYRIKFLANAYPPSFDINRLQSNLLCGSRVVVRLTNRPGTYGNGGTFPIKDQLKESEFKWNEDRKIWSIFLERGSISSPFECVQYLNAQPWIRSADGIVASFSWEDQQHRMSIVGGRVQPEGSAVPLPANEFSPPAQPEPCSPKNVGNSPATLASTTQPGLTNRLPQSADVAKGVFETRIAGMRYEGRMEKARHLAVGAFVRLEREPGNSHDRNAIQVLTAEGVRIGYLSRHVAAHLASGLDAWGGTSPAKVTSNWTQPPPHFHVAIQIAFPLPPGVVIPQELDAKAHLEDNPFVDTRPRANADRTPSPHPVDYVEPKQARSESAEDIPRSDPDESLPEIPSPDGPPRLSGDLTQAQEDALGDLLDPSLGGLVTELYLSGCCPWPYIGYEGLDSQGRCTDSILEVAWPDFKVGIALPTNDVRPFVANGWTILPATSVNASAMRRLFAFETEAAPAHDKGSTRQADMPATRTEVGHGIGDFAITDRSFQHGPFSDEEPDDDIPF
jgi:DNA helicase IV